MKKAIIIILISLFVALILGIFAYFFLDGKMPPVVNFSEEKPNMKSVDFSQINKEFNFSAKIPEELEAEYAPQLKAINVYNSNLYGENNIEKSQIYITYFKANKFLTLNTMDIIKKELMTINGQEAILYEITKKFKAPVFYGQPSWRNFIHKVLDIRATDNNPSVFYSFAYNPKMSEKSFYNFINSLEFKN